MALSDKETYKEQERRTRKKPGESNRHYSDAQKIELCQMYLVTGNLALSAATLKIPEITARWWKAKDWWKQLEAELRVSEDIQLSARLKKIVAKTLDQVEDRLENGDFIFDSKSGKLIRKPVNLKDVHRVAVDMVDKVQMLEKKQVQSPELEDSVANKMDKLAAQFAALATKINNKPPVEVTDVVYIGGEHAVHEERETGLQAGERTVQQPSGADQSKVGTDSNPQESQ